MPSNEDDDGEDDDNEEDSDEDEEDDDDDSDDDNDVDVDSTNEINEAEKKAADLLLKEKNALNDIALIQDIFIYVDRTSKRIIRSLTLQEELRILQDENKRIHELLKMSQNREEPLSMAQNYSEDEEQGDNESVTWSQYEELSDGQRAQLLERSLSLLNNNVNSVNRNNVNRRAYSDERKSDHSEERKSKDKKHGLR